jgi:hypothetical protein
MNELAQKLMDVVQQQSIPTNTQEKKNSNFNPHLALCHETNKSANNRHKSLMLKSNDVGFVDLIKSEHEAAQFEAFCNTLTDSSVLLDLYNIVKSDKQLLKNILRKNK